MRTACSSTRSMGSISRELLELLAEPGRVKVVHAARQDLEVLYLAGGRVPLPVFDTQIAAALVGLAPQIGYAELVARQLGHSIDKGQTRTDWSRRPLTAEQLAYAADDVHHLLELHTLARSRSCRNAAGSTGSTRTRPRSRTRRCIARSQPMRGAA